MPEINCILDAGGGFRLGLTVTVVPGQNFAPHISPTPSNRFVSFNINVEVFEMKDAFGNATSSSVDPEDNTKTRLFIFIFIFNFQLHKHFIGLQIVLTGAK